MIKLQGPEGCTSCSHGGIVYKADKRGIFTVSLEASKDFIKFHKFTTVIEKFEPLKVETVKVADELDELDEPVKLDKVDELDLDEKSLEKVSVKLTLDKKVK